MILKKVWVGGDGSQPWTSVPVTSKWQWMRTPRKASIRNFKRFVRINPDAFWPWQIDWTCFKGTTWEDLLELSWRCYNYRTHVWRRIRTVKRGVWVTSQSGTKAWVFCLAETRFVPQTCGHKGRYCCRPWKGGASSHLAQLGKQQGGRASLISRP